MASHREPLRLPLATVVFPFVTAVLFLSLWPIISGGRMGFHCSGSPVLLPVVDSAPQTDETPYDSYIRVRADGMVLHNEKWFPNPEFPIMFQRVARTSLPHAGARVFLKVDRVAPFGTVRLLLRNLRDVGIGEATLLVEARSEYGPAAAPNPGVQWTRSARH